MSRYAPVEASGFDPIGDRRPITSINRAVYSSAYSWTNTPNLYIMYGHMHKEFSKMSHLRQYMCGAVEPLSSDWWFIMSKFYVIDLDTKKLVSLDKQYGIPLHHLTKLRLLRTLIEPEEADQLLGIEYAQ